MPDPRDGLVPATCPLCRQSVNAATSVSDPEHRPKAGDFCVCYHCFGVLRYTDGQGSVRQIEPHELSPEVIRKLQEAAHIVKLIQAMRRSAVN